MHILVVDDDTGIRESLRAFLEEEGYEVSVARDGEEALRLALATRGPLVVLLDLLLPTLSGEDMLAATLEYMQSDVTRAPISFIIVTATWHQLLTPRLLALTQRYDIPVLHKPFNTERLLEGIARAAERAEHLVTG